MKLFVLPDTFSICRFSADHAIPSIPACAFVSVTRTSTELSVVCRSDQLSSDALERSDGWRCIAVEGPLDFALTGVLHSLLKPLATAKISVFTISTFETDYLLVRGESLDRAIEVLARDGHIVRSHS